MGSLGGLEWSSGLLVLRFGCPVMRLLALELLHLRVLVCVLVTFRVLILRR